MRVEDPALARYRQILLDWWETNARDYPWRHDRTPYRTAVAELMLRRTQADQVSPVFERFVQLYPSLADAAAAAPETLQSLLYPLGLVWRARGMIAFFQEAHARFGADLPSDVPTLLTLPGVGDYVAAAVACFANGQPRPLIDTNVVRVLGRIFGLNTEGEARRRSDVRELATLAVGTENPAAYHYALLDFGAKVCVARKPRCHACPFARSFGCQYYAREVAPNAE